MSLLSVNNISKKGLGDFWLQEVTFSQRKNQKIAIAGETGSGKSTLLRIIAGLEDYHSGKILFNNEHVIGPADNLIPGHPGIAYLTQDFELPKFLRVAQILQYANTLPHERASELFKVCEISHLLLRKADELSGGERQRIALTRLLISSPRLLLLDEPFSNLAMMHRIILKNVLKRICKQLDITCILVSHDPDDVLSWADEIIVLKKGIIVQKGTPKKIYSKPIDEYTAGLFGPYNLISPSQAIEFFSSWKKKPRNKLLMIRPEEIKNVRKKNSFVSGRVTNVSFFGSYYMLEIEVGKNRILVKERKKVREGDVVHLKCSSNYSRINSDAMSIKESIHIK